jgi:hypothetical protein
METTNKTKRRPGIPHETLQYIVEQSGGSIEHFVSGKETWVRVSLNSKSFEAPNNTLLLIQILQELK